MTALYVPDIKPTLPRTGEATKKRNAAKTDTSGVRCACGLYRAAFASRREFVEHRGLCCGT